MAIRPIINVKYNNNYNNLSFEAKKKNKNHHDTQRSAGFMKSIPLAAIIAMSPMNSAQAQNNQYAPEEKIVLQQEYNDGKEKFKIHYVSTDGDDSNAEKLKLSFSEENIIVSHFVDNELTDCKFSKYHTMTVDSLEITHIKTKIGDTNLGTTTQYNVVGDRSTIHTAATPLDNPDRMITYPERNESENIRQTVPKELFDYLLQVTNGTVPAGERHITIDLSNSR